MESTYTKNHIEKNISISELKRTLSSKYLIDIKNISVIPVTGNTNLNIKKYANTKLLEDNFINKEYAFAYAAFDRKYQSDLFCNAGFNSLCIMPNGDTYPCCKIRKNGTAVSLARHAVPLQRNAQWRLFA